MKLSKEQHSKGMGRFSVAGLMLVVAFLFSGQQIQAQGQKHIIQLSGVVFGEDSVAGMPGIHVYVPKAGRGTTTNHIGYFSMPILAGDSVVIRGIGYHTQHYIVPENLNDKLTIIVEMTSDTTFLNDIEITPFPTEEILKEAILALNIPLDEDFNNPHYNDELLALMMQTMPMDGEMNYRYYMQNQQYYQNDRFSQRTNPFLNPFNWAKFFKSLKAKNK